MKYLKELIMESYFPVIKNNCVKEYDSFNILKDYDILNLTINFTVDYEAEDEGLRLQFAYKVGEFLTHYYTPFLVFAGGFGNILSVIVFFRTKLRMLSSSYYLAALGISDTCFLLGAFISWLNYIDISIYNKNYFCQFFTYLCSLCSFLSAWFVVAFTVERFIAVLYPLKRHLCTIKRACTVLFILFIIGCFLNIPTFIYAAPLYSEYLNDSICDVRPENKFQMKIFNYIDTVIVFVIPFSIIAVLNILTAKAVWKVSGVRRIVTVKKRLRAKNLYVGNEHGKSEFSSASCLNNVETAQIDQKTSSISSQIKVTKMLLLVSSVFAFLNLPSYVMRIKAFLVENENESQGVVITQYISWLLFVTNFGINFILYCFSGQNFRKALIEMFSALKNKHIRNTELGNTQLTGSARARFLTRNNSSHYNIQDLHRVNSVFEKINPV